MLEIFGGRERTGIAAKGRRDRKGERKRYRLGKNRHEFLEIRARTHISGSYYTLRLHSEKHLPDGCDILTDPAAITGMARMKFRGANWAVPVRVREILFQGFPRERITGVARRCLSTKRGDCRLWAVQETRNREQHVVSIL